MSTVNDSTLPALELKLRDRLLGVWGRALSYKSNGAERLTKAGRQFATCSIIMSNSSQCTSAVMLMPLGKKLWRIIPALAPMPTISIPKPGSNQHDNSLRFTKRIFIVNNNASTIAFNSSLLTFSFRRPRGSFYRSRFPYRKRLSQTTSGAFICN